MLPSKKSNQDCWKVQTMMGTSTSKKLIIKLIKTIEKKDMLTMRKFQRIKMNMRTITRITKTRMMKCPTEKKRRKVLKMMSSTKKQQKK